MDVPENPTERWRALRLLRREILSSQVTVALNKKLDRDSSAVTLELSEMKVPTALDLEYAQYGDEIPRWRALELLRRMILEAQITLSLDKKLGRDPSDVTLELVETPLPDIVDIERARRYDEANSPQKRAMGPSTHLIHPGVILLEEFIEPLGLAPEQLALELGLNPAQFTSITQGAQDITAEVATLLSQRFDLSESFWVNLQATYDRALAADH